MFHFRRYVRFSGGIEIKHWVETSYSFATTLAHKYFDASRQFKFECNYFNYVKVAEGQTDNSTYLRLLFPSSRN